MQNRINTSITMSDVVYLVAVDGLMAILPAAALGGPFWIRAIKTPGHFSEVPSKYICHYICVKYRCIPTPFLDDIYTNID